MIFMNHNQVPRAALFLREGDSAVCRLAAQTGSDISGRRFKMSMYSGRIVQTFYWGKLAIDLNGIQPARKELPALREHDRTRIVGWHDSISIDENGVRSEGRFAASTPDGQEVLALAQEGYPWQASMTAEPKVIEHVKEGAAAEVNGLTMTGPGYIFRKSLLYEGSFCALGADADTGAVAASKGQDQVTLNCDWIGEVPNKSEAVYLTSEQILRLEFESDPEKVAFIRMANGDPEEAFQQFSALRRSELRDELRQQRKR